jgi:hypothetical protein
LKKIVAILLLAILSFNWIGYRWVMGWMQESADQKLESRLDNNEYDEASLIEIKVSIDLPYQTDWTDFERYDGEIVVNGIHYKYVKRKVQDGMLVLKCIPNDTKQSLLNARDKFFSLVNDLQQDQPAKNSNNSNSFSFKNMIGDCDEPFTLSQLSRIESPVSSAYCNKVQLISEGYQLLPDQPPRV